MTQAVLAGDVGGTNTRLAVFPAHGTGEPLFQRIYPSASFPGLQAVVQRFVADLKDALPEVRVARAGFGVAGPTDGTYVKFTNLPWVERSRDLVRAFGFDRALFVNDFAAICRAVPHLDVEHLWKFGGDGPQRGAPIAVLGAGTGLGVGFLVANAGGGHAVVQSGGGHVGFAPRDDLQLRFARFLQSKRDGSYLENILSGRGLENLYRFLLEDSDRPEMPESRAAMEKEPPAAVITARGLANTDPTCAKALEVFCAIYGAVASNLAILLLAGGGVYVAGGIAGHIRTLLSGSAFRDAFEAQEQYQEFLRSVPRYLITHPQPGLMGAALAAVED